MPNAAKERERSRRRRRDATILKLRGQLADLQPKTEIPDYADLDLSDPASVIAEWAAATLIVPTGLLAGQPFRFEPWQVDYLRAALADGVREAALCCSRKQGKSGLIAATLLAYLCGPLNRPGWRAIVVSLTGTLAKELRRQVAEICEVSGLSDTVRDYATPTPGRIIGLNGAEVTVLAADKASGHSVGVDLTVTDESGLLAENKRGLWDAVYSSVSTRNGRNLHISIRGHSPMFSELRERRDDPAVVWHEYAADPDCRLDDVDQWRKANPGLGTIKSLDYMQDASDRAIATPAAAPGFRAFDLNIPGDPDADPIVSIAAYQRCIAAVLPERSGDAWLGWDLGGANSFSAAAAYWPESGRVELYAGVGGIPDLRTRSRADGCGDLYLRMQQSGELWLYDDWEETPVLQFVGDVMAHVGDAAVAGLYADQYKAPRLRKGLRQSGHDDLAAQLIVRPVRWESGNDDCIGFQGAVTGQRVAFPPNLMLAHAIAESSLMADNNTLIRLDRSREKGRIDVLMACMLAVAAGERNRPDPDAVPATRGSMAD